jgi:hypothetical protein
MAARNGSGVSPKVVGATLGGAIATFAWVLLGHYALKGLGDTELSALTGATSTIFSFIIGYRVNDPLRS